MERVKRVKQTGIVVCTYNKKDYVERCVQSIFDSHATDYDVIVVDNASTDGTVEMLKDVFGERITLLCNEENLGGSGGFNTGLRYALEQDLAAERMSIRPFFETGNTEILIRLIKENKGISFLPKFAVQEDLNNGSLKEIKVGDFEMTMYNYMPYYYQKH